MPESGSMSESMISNGGITSVLLLGPGKAPGDGRGLFSKARRDIFDAFTGTGSDDSAGAGAGVRVGVGLDVATCLDRINGINGVETCVPSRGCGLITGVILALGGGLVRTGDVVVAGG